MTKTLVIICDGLPDRPLKEFNNQTPLEMAVTPHLDHLAEKGINGMMHTVDIGVRPGSDTAHLSLFGYDPYVYYTGRGPYECAGIGMDVRPGDVALRANVGTINDAGIIIDRRAGRIDSTVAIAKYLGNPTFGDVQVMLQPSLGHRMGMVLRGLDLSAQVSDQDPHEVGHPPHEVLAVDQTEAARKTADVLNQFSHWGLEKLKDAPFNRERVANNQLAANVVLFRGAGMLPDNLIPFHDKFGVRACFVAGAPMYKGIARTLGMTIYNFDDTASVTGLPNSDLSIKIAAATKALETFDMVFVHIKAADSLAEDGNVQGKVTFIEKIDSALAPLIERDDINVVVTADHTTSCQLRRHTADPVPVSICGEGIRHDDVRHYTERECAKGRLGTIRGANLMPILLDLMGVSTLYGA